MIQYSGFLQMRIDPFFSPNQRKSLDLVLSQFKGALIEDSFDSQKIKNKLTIDFISENSLHNLKSVSDFKVCIIDQNQGLFSFSQNLDESMVDVVLDSDLDLKQLSYLILPKLMGQVRIREEEFISLGIKNLKKFENLVRQVLNKNHDDFFSSDFLLTYTQDLVDLEKELIQVDDLLKVEKILKQFVKVNFEKSKFRFFTVSDLARIEETENFLILPHYRKEFIAMELSWNEDDSLRLMKKLFFYYNLINFFNSQNDVDDPFSDESLWYSVLDAIPFPVALLSHDGVIHQHNTLFSKLSFPLDHCLKLKLREKIHINDIPYNIYRKEIHHLNEEKILYVFFTESFFLKGDGNLTPTGQELGIISSSIAHELNNPIAGIQAAIALLQLGENLNHEAEQILTEMKNGALRCKQLVETFLGFSRANPSYVTTTDMILSPIELCYQQAQNLLRFRTVESGIRFNFNSIKHADFRSKINPSLLTMTFYLILGELMTLYSHHLLVANKNQIEKVIKGDIIESSQEIQIQLHELNISNIVFSKLIQNLLNIEHFVLQISDYSLRFIHNP